MPGTIAEIAGPFRSAQGFQQAPHVRSLVRLHATTLLSAQLAPGAHCTQLRINMTRTRLVLLATMFVLTGHAAWAKKANHPIHHDVEVVEINAADRDMQKAFTYARATLNTVLPIAASKDPRYDTVSLKVTVHQGKKTEYLWVSPFTVKGDTFTGSVNNEPTIVTNLNPGQDIQFKRADIVDWMYVDTQTKIMHGNFTTCVMMKNAPADEVKEMKSAYGLDCTR
jgi:uncharacterized protein YegJ (DUF2314 family)